MGEVSQLLRAANSGDANASGQLFALLYGDLKRLARGHLRRNGSVEELNTTAVVHESFLKLAERGAILPADRPAFFSYVGHVMRSVVLDRVRERQARKRGGNEIFVTLTTEAGGELLDDHRLLAIDDAMQALAKLSPELHGLVEMRYFAGLTVAEIAEITGKAARTVERDWEKARAVLRRLMAEG